MRHCTIPEIGGLRKWYEKNFSHPCEVHDELYEKKVGKLKADYLLAKYMAEQIEYKPLKDKLFVYYPTIAATFLVLTLIGWVRYYKGWELF